METIINAQIPKFKAQALRKGEFKTVSNEDIKGKWVTFFFYPADFTFVYPTELVDLTGKYEELEKTGVEVFSVNCDTRFVYKAWYDASDSIKKISYTMLVDPLAVLTKGFDVYREDEDVAYRGTFLVGPEGKIKIIEIRDNSISHNADELVRKVSAAQFVEPHPGEVCPVKQKQGEGISKPSIDLVGKLQKETGT